MLIIGEGPERTALEDLIKELGLKNFVFLPGANANPFYWMKRCDAYVCSSEYEGMSNSVIQASYCGANVFSRPCGGAKEIFEVASHGKIIEFDDPLVMPEYLALGKAPEFDLSQRRKNLRQQFSSEEVCEKLMKVSFS